jgi:hypothetical protein
MEHRCLRVVVVSIAHEKAGAAVQRAGRDHVVRRVEVDREPRRLIRPRLKHAFGGVRQDDANLALIAIHERPHSHTLVGSRSMDAKR